MEKFLLSKVVKYLRRGKENSKSLLYSDLDGLCLLIPWSLKISVTEFNFSGFYKNSRAILRSIAIFLNQCCVFISYYNIFQRALHFYLKYYNIYKNYSIRYLNAMLIIALDIGDVICNNFWKCNMLWCCIRFIMYQWQ